MLGKSNMVESIGRSNMVDGLFFCSTVTSHRMGLVKVGVKRPTLVRRRLSGTHGVLGMAIQGGCLPMSGMKERSLLVFSNHNAFHR